MRKRLIDAREKQIALRQPAADAHLQSPESRLRLAMSHQFAGNGLGVCVSRGIVRQVSSFRIDDGAVRRFEIEPVSWHRVSSGFLTIARPVSSDDLKLSSR